MDGYDPRKLKRKKMVICISRVVKLSNKEIESYEKDV